MYALYTEQRSIRGPDLKKKKKIDSWIWIVWQELINKTLRNYILFLTQQFITWCTNAIRDSLLTTKGP